MKNVLVLLIVLFTMPAQSELVDLGTITRDTDTGLDWLDLTETVGRSYDDVSSSFGLGQEFYGWRYATNTEVEDLFNQMFENFVPTYANGSPGRSFLKEGGYSTIVEDTERFQDLFGFSGEYYLDGYGSDSVGDILNTVSLGWYENENGQLHTMGVQNLAATSNIYVVSTDFDGNYESQRYNGHPHAGTFLVQEVPVPATAWLFGSALVGLAGMGRNRN